ncbi:MAG: MFS transporter [Alphaproteobacteria bacterium]|nr:MFS transporter [Alphaproteobacteria bacterium]
MEIRRNILLFKLYYLFASMWPLSVLAIVLFQQITGSYAFALGVFAISTISQSVAEVPTGIISDKLGRRKTMIMSAVFELLASLLFALSGTFVCKYLLVIGGIVWGIAEAFASGTDDAFMYETMEELRKSDKYDILYARSKTFGQIGLAVGALIAACITYFYSLVALAWGAVIIDIIPIFICLRFVEPKNHNGEDCTSMKHFVIAIKAFLQNKKLRMLSTIQMLSHGISFAGHRFEGAYFNLLIPTWAVNVARIIKQTCGAISFHVAPYFRKFGFYRILVASTIGMTVIKATAVILNNFATPFIQSCVNIFYGTAATADSALLQKELSPKQRATMGSIVSLFGGILAAVIYVLVGVVADMTSVWLAVVMLIASNLLISGGYYWMLKKYKS